MLITELTAAAVAAAAAVASLSDVAAYVLPFLSRHQTHFVSCLDCWLIQDGPKTDCLCRLKACIHGWRKINLPGLTPASLNQSGPNLADVHRSRSDNVQEILGQNRRLWWVPHRESFCPQNQTIFSKHSDGHFTPNLATTLKCMSLETYRKRFSKIFRLV